MRAILNDKLHTTEDQEAALRMIKYRWTNGTWRNVYKALTFFDFILKHGSDGFLALIMEEKSEWQHRLKELNANYQATDEKGKDQGINVRVKAGAILELLGDRETLQAVRQEERAKLDRLQDRRSQFNDTVNTVKQQAGSPIKEKPRKDVVSDFSDDEFDDFQSASPLPVAKSTGEMYKDESIPQAHINADQKEKDPFDDLLKF
jgi:epsin